MKYKRFQSLSLLVFSFIILLTSGCTNDKTNIPDGFIIEEGHTLNLVASEPLIKDPVDLEFDEHGDAYVLEMPGYPYEDVESRILILKDNDEDGQFDDRIIFAEELELASSIMPYKKGILVAAPPYLLFLRDTDGDLVADERDTLMSGFSTGNLQHNYNGLTYGIDNWIYAANGGNSGKPYWWGDSSSVVELRENDLRFNIEKRILEKVGRSSGGYELGIDEYGRIFETHNLEHISQLIFPGRYTESPDIYSFNSLANVSDHEENGLSRIYPVGEQETRVNHPEQSGFFSGACGITYYGGNALGDEYDQTVWVADVVLNLVHVDKLQPRGSSFKATRQLQKKDFLASSERSFRPVNMTVGPEGAMYLVDIHRDVIEHPEWIPDDIEETLNIDAGKDQGRIYRIDNTEIKSKFDYRQFQSLQGLISSLGHGNQWVRNTAHRLLLDHNYSKADIDLLNEAAQSKNAYSRLHALWILSAKNYISNDQIVLAMQDEDPGIRENTLIIGESDIDHSGLLLESVIKLLEDDNQRVRMQAALSLSTISKKTFDQNEDHIHEGLLKAAKLEMDQWNIAAITFASKYKPAQVFNSFLQHIPAKTHEKLFEALAQIAAQQPSETSTLLTTLAQSNEDAAFKTNVVVAVTEHIHVQAKGRSFLKTIEQLEKTNDPGLIAALAALRNKLSLPVSRKYLSQSKNALTQIADKSLPDSTRFKQMALIKLLPYPTKSNVLYSLLSNKESLGLQEEALQQLWSSDDPGIGLNLLSKWKDLGPQSRRTASDILLYKKVNHDALLTGLENGTINIGEMNFDLERRRTLLWWTDDEQTIRRAQALFSDSGVINRKDALDQMKEALTLQGNATTGAEVFNQLCAQCHIYGASGTDAGPVLTEINRKSKASLLHDILDPNAAVDTKYINHRLETGDGALHVGMVDQETDKAVTIKKMGGAIVTIEKVDIKSFTSLGTSLMPEGLEGNMTVQNMADLLAYLQEGVSIEN